MPYRSIFRPGLFDGQTIVVTGGGSGIGRCTAHELSSLGARIALVGRTQEKLDQVKEELGGDAFTFAGDLREEAEVKEAVDAVLKWGGRIDGLVNNAAVVRHMPLAEWDTGCFDEHVATNIRAPFFLIQAALPALRESPVRSVVNIGSSSGTLRRVGQSVYGMTKSALDYLTQTLAG